MAAPRLPFLWPMLSRTFEASNPTVRSARAAVRNRAFHSSSRRRVPEVAPQQQRYGTANEPLPHLSENKSSTPGSQQPAEPTKALPRIGEKLQKDGEAEVEAKKDAQKHADAKREPTTVDGDTANAIRTDPILDAADSTPSERKPQAPSAPPDHPLESLLETVPDPTQHAEEQQKDQASRKIPREEEKNSEASFDEHAPPTKAPHINTPRHVHHFDTYGFMRRLVAAGWSEPQAITVMKGMRVMLAENMDVARDALVSKSQVENETYLFRAACAELKTEVTSRRKGEQEKMRTERTQLQHEVDILSQRVGQESGVLKDDLKGMFDDRKMAVRNEQRSMESKIQRLNYQITVDLQADAKSEVEGLRWVMTRRVIIALGTVILMVVGSLKLYSNAVHEQELDAKRKANMKSGGTQTDSPASNAGDVNGNSREFGGGLAQMKEGDNPAYVTLG